MHKFNHIIAHSLRLSLKHLIILYIFIKKNTTDIEKIMMAKNATSIFMPV